MRAFERKCARAYDERLAEYVRITDATTRRYEEKLLSAGAAAAETRAELELKVRRMKVACQKWRADYQADAERRTSAILTTLEGRYLQEVEGLCRRLAAQKEREAVARLVEQEKEQRLLVRRSKEEQEAETRARAEAHDAARKAEGTEMLGAQRETLEKLWDALEADAGARNAFLLEAVRTAAYDPPLLALFEGETAKLAAQLPLLKTVTRREFVKYRLKCIHRFQKDPTLENARELQGAGSPGHELLPAHAAEARDVLMNELSLLNSRLVAGIEEYEGKFRASFMYRGVKYLDALRSDGARMPELPMAVGSVERARLREESTF
jgi:hypothetical protein